MHAVSSSNFIINRLRLHGIRENTPAQRLRWQRLVEELNFHPPGLPPAAVLLVKNIHFAMLPPEKNRSKIFKQREPLWQMQLQALAGAAARPRQGRLPESAEAVVFSDAAELFACLALEARQGNVAQRWWWRALLPRLTAQSSCSLTQVLALLCEQPRFAPATWEHLQTWRQAAAVVRQISPSVARNLMQALAREFDLASLTPSFAGELGAEEFYSPRQTETTFEPRQAWLSRDDHDLGFWEEYLPDLAPERFEQKAHVVLLGLGLLLHRAPHTLRQPAFIRRFHHWIACQPQLSAPTTLLAGKSRDIENAWAPPVTMQPDARLFSPTKPGANALIPDEPNHSAQSLREVGQQQNPALQSNEMPPATQQNAQLFSPATPRPNALVPDEPNHSARSLRQTDRQSLALPEQASQAPTPDGQIENGGEAAPHLNASVAPPMLRKQHADRISAECANAPISPAEETQPLAKQFPGENCRTELGGILFLIPFLQHLRLFTTEPHPFPVMHDLSAWAWLELIGRTLLRETFAEVAHDPIWRVLAILDGRQPEEPGGMAFRGEAEYILPAAWLVSTGSAPDVAKQWLWHFDKTRLRVLHPAGFVAADLMITHESLASRLQTLQQEWHLEAASLRQATDVEFTVIQEESFLNPARCLTSKRFFQHDMDGSPLISKTIHPPTHTDVAQAGKTALDRWLQFLLPYLRWRLGTALKLENADGATISRQLFFRRGELFVTRAHIDLVMSLNDATLNVRVAGLDCNPGWVPALCRVVTFHYT